MGLFSDCRQMVKYSGKTIEISTVKGPVQVPIEISGVAIKPQLLQTAGSILQILDWLQFTACQKIHELKKLKDIPSKVIADLILKQDEDARVIAHFALISIAVCNSPGNFEKVLADLIAVALPRVKEASKPTESLSKETRESHEAEKLLERIGGIESRIKELDETSKDLEVKLKEIGMEKRRSEREREKLIGLLNREVITFGFADIRGLEEGLIRMDSRELVSIFKLEKNLSEAIDVFPYLSQAIKKNEPLNIENSLRALECS